MDEARKDGKRWMPIDEWLARHEGPTDYHRLPNLDDYIPEWRRRMQHRVAVRREIQDITLDDYVPQPPSNWRALVRETPSKRPDIGPGSDSWPDE